MKTARLLALAAVVVVAGLTLLAVRPADAGEKLRTRPAVLTVEQPDATTAVATEEPVGVKAQTVGWYRGTYRAYYGPRRVTTVYRTNGAVPLAMPLPMYGYGYPTGMPYYGAYYPGYAAYPYWGPYPAAYGYPVYGYWAW